MPKVLVVDDSPDITYLLKLMLEKQNLTVVVASSKKEAGEELVGDSIDLILLDIELGLEDGRSICKDLKAIYSDLPIILISARPHLLEQYKDYGADAAIEKPFEMRTLKDQINKFLRAN